MEVAQVHVAEPVLAIDPVRPLHAGSLHVAAAQHDVERRRVALQRQAHFAAGGAADEFDDALDRIMGKLA
jgi:hypothetical protein